MPEILIPFEVPAIKFISLMIYRLAVDVRATIGAVCVSASKLPSEFLVLCMGHSETLPYDTTVYYLYFLPERIQLPSESEL